MSNLNRAENRAKWLSLVKAYEQSELNKIQFCEERAIKKATLDYWIRKSRYQPEQDAIVGSGFVNLISKKETFDEFRLHFKGVDIFIPLQTDPNVLKSFLSGLTDQKC